jgi:hypothetical protein
MILRLYSCHLIKNPGTNITANFQEFYIIGVYQFHAFTNLTAASCQTSHVTTPTNVCLAVNGQVSNKRTVTVLDVMPHVLTVQRNVFLPLVSMNNLC